MSLRIAVLGATGRMGLRVCSAVESGAGLELVATPGRADLAQGSFDRVDVVIDFSLPEALRNALPLLGNAALVTGTTGLLPEDQARVVAHSQRAPVLQAANFSPGVNLLLDLVARAAQALPDHDIEIVEAHHRHKVDAPSGTALALAEAAASARGLTLDAVARHGRHGRAGPRATAEIGIHALRAGGVVGDHTVWLASEAERIELGHRAGSRAVFAEGAVQAARWIAGRGPGLYTMRQVLFDR